ncbi:hypothetical protein EG68_00632 [Paragonimus skrjabini miyazakii]|uniref:Cystatin n=1 Tax=Paragonimus skrjabini miyazakii TaxID=59628 RepID=A0A8S9Z2S2_9TREM|nr:hypothetical protein EG68_00632 [Paragonimus skrjabini miyazakii]
MCTMYFPQVMFTVVGLFCILCLREVACEAAIEPVEEHLLGARSNPRCPVNMDSERLRQALSNWTPSEHETFVPEQSDFTILDVASQVVGWIQYYYTIQLDTGLCYSVLVNDQSIGHVENVECPEVSLGCPDID